MLSSWKHGVGKVTLRHVVGIWLRGVGGLFRHIDRDGMSLHYWKAKVHEWMTWGGKCLKLLDRKAEHGLYNNLYNNLNNHFDNHCDNYFDNQHWQPLWQPTFTTNFTTNFHNQLLQQMVQLYNKWHMSRHSIIEHDGLASVHGSRSDGWCTLLQTVIDMHDLWFPGQLYTHTVWLTMWEHAGNICWNES
jgi:hypothetical protein